jgi:two-component system response regulator FixJ
MNPTVFVVDDDEAMRDALVQLLESAGLRVETHAEGASFLAAYAADRPGCLLLDMAMPGMRGLEVQAAL